VGFWDTFRDFRPWTRRTLVASFLLGVFLLIAFWLTDLVFNLTLGGWDPKPEWLRHFNYEWFQNHAYISNIYAGFTSFLIGVPVAAVVLATFTIEREDQAALEKVNRLSEVAWREYRDAIEEYCGEQQIEKFEAAVKAMLDIHDETFKQFGNYRDAPRTHRDYSDQIAFLAEQIPRWSAALTDLSHRVGLETTLRLKWYALRDDWTTLHQYVRLQRLDRGLRWMDRDVNSYLQLRMSSEEHPFVGFMRIHEGPYRHNIVSDSMASAVENLEQLVKLDNSAFDVVVVHKIENYFPRFIVLDYKEEAAKAVEALRGLRSAVEQVETANWPANAKVAEPIA